MAITIQRYRRCTACGQFKIAEKYFYRKSSGREGFTSICKSCHLLQQRDYREYRKKHFGEQDKEYQREYQKAWQAANKEKQRQASKAYYLKHRDRLIEQQRQRRVKKKAAIAIDCNPTKAAQGVETGG